MALRSVKARKTSLTKPLSDGTTFTVWYWPGIPVTITYVSELDV